MRTSDAVTIRAGRRNPSPVSNFHGGTRVDVKSRGVSPSSPDQDGKPGFLQGVRSWPRGQPRTGVSSRAGSGLSLERGASKSTTFLFLSPIPLSRRLPDSGADRRPSAVRRFEPQDPAAGSPLDGFDGTEATLEFLNSVVEE